MIEVLRALFRWWSTDTFVKTGAVLIALGLGYFAVELLSAASVDPFIQFWIGVGLSLCAYAASSWYQQEPRRAMLWQVAGFLGLVTTVCWLQFSYAILNPWFVAVICTIALWRLFVQSSEYHSAIVLSAGFFGGALVPPLIFAEFFTPIVTTLSFAVWWVVGLVVAYWFTSTKLFNLLSVTFASLITVFVWLTGISVGMVTAIPIVLLFCCWLLTNVLLFHGAIMPKAKTSRWYEAAIATTFLSALVWMPGLLFAFLLGIFALVTFGLSLFHYYPIKLTYHPYTFLLASGAFFGAAFITCPPLGILALSLVWVLYTAWWVFSSYKKLLPYSPLLWFVPAVLVAWYGLLTPLVAFTFAASLLFVSALALRTRYTSLGMWYFVVGWTVLIAAVVFTLLPLTIEAVFMTLVVIGLLGALVLMLSSLLALPSQIFLISLGSLAAGLCGVYFLANAELQTSERLSWYLVPIAFLWGGLLASFLVTLKKRLIPKATVLWVLIIVGSLPTLLLIAGLLVPSFFLTSAFLITLVHSGVVLLYFRRYQLAVWLTPWILSGTLLASLALAATNFLSLVYTAATVFLGVLGTVGAVALVIGVRQNTYLLGSHFTLQYVVLQLIAWLTTLTTITVTAVFVAPSGYSSLYILSVLTLASYALTYGARLIKDRWLHLVSFGVLFLTLGRVLAVEAWRLPESLVLVPFLLTGIVLISLTMKGRKSEL